MNQENWHEIALSCAHRFRRKHYCALHRFEFQRTHGLDKWKSATAPRSYPKFIEPVNHKSNCVGFAMQAEEMGRTWDRTRRNSIGMFLSVSWETSLMYSTIGQTATVRTAGHRTDALPSMLRWSKGSVTHSAGKELLWSSILAGKHPSLAISWSPTGAFRLHWLCLIQSMTSGEPNEVCLRPVVSPWKPMHGCCPPSRKLWREPVFERP